MGEAKGLPNLIYTDGREWALDRTGERPDGQPIVRLHDDPTEKGKAAVTRPMPRVWNDCFATSSAGNQVSPHNPSGLANYLAPLSRFLRSEVENALGQSGSAVALLANEWRQFFFPDSDNAKFADAYAQTVTYAMLLARLSGATKLDPADAAKTLDKNNGLLARTLELLGQPEARKELSVGFEMLQRSLEALDPKDFRSRSPTSGSISMRTFSRPMIPSFARITGLLHSARSGGVSGPAYQRTPGKALWQEARLCRRWRGVPRPCRRHRHLSGGGGQDTGSKRSPNVRAKPAVPARARQMAENMYGFEILVGPYAVAHLRLTQALEGAINDFESSRRAAGEAGQTAENLFGRHAGKPKFGTSWRP